MALVNGRVYNYECTGITINFPNSSHGIIFALSELVGSLFAFIQIPIIEQVKGLKNFLPFKYFELGMALFTLITIPIIVLIGKKWDKANILMIF